MNSLINTGQAPMSGSRHGRSRALASYHAVVREASSDMRTTLLVHNARRSERVTTRVALGGRSEEKA
ncbi:hypothetical protein GCM10009661_58730 [Catellatospora chokoriensis]